MSTLKVSVFSKSAPIADGTTVDAWAASRFNVNPSKNHYPPNGSADASGATVGGNVSLTGLFAVPYWVRVWAPYPNTNWLYVTSDRVGDTHPVVVAFWR